MSNAFKCDRCGFYYDREKTPRKIRLVEENNRFLSEFGSEINLCDECYEKLKKWIEDKDAAYLEKSLNVNSDAFVYKGITIKKNKDYPKYLNKYTDGENYLDLTNDFRLKAPKKRGRPKKNKDPEYLDGGEMIF